MIFFLHWVRKVRYQDSSNLLKETQMFGYDEENQFSAESFPKTLCRKPELGRQLHAVKLAVRVLEPLSPTVNKVIKCSTFRCANAIFAFQ